MRHLPVVRSHTRACIVALALSAALAPACASDDAADAPAAGPTATPDATRIDDSNPTRTRAPALAQNDAADPGATAALADAGAAAESACSRYKSARANLTEAKWTGSVSTCTAGDISAASRDSALRLVNLYRAMAGLGALTTSAESNRLAQQCALLMRANNTISHTPPSSWRCYTAEGGRAAGSSSLAGGQDAVGAVDGYMIDPGNPTTIGHRRWVLSNWLTELGFGSADGFSCQYQPARASSRGGKPWTAWPPPGEVPAQLITSGTRYGGSLDQTGWTVQSDSVSLAGARVTVTNRGAIKPVTVTQLGSGYGSTHAIRFNPSGWTSAAGETYSVAIQAGGTAIAYEVKVVDCR